MTAPASFDLAGRVALVTGGNGGIGRGIALGFAQAGAAVAIFGRNTAKNAEALGALQGAGARAMALAVDVTDRAALEPAFRQVEAELGPVDILVNNAGITRDGTLHKMSFEDWNEVMRINLGGCFNMAKASFPGMRERGWGRIVNISSVNGVRPQPNSGAYTAAKHGVIGLTKVASLENAQWSSPGE